jgi:sterol desaturase/sphingolipid hydroxylase (fatty acid hydroxylase superfamily)
MTTAQKQGNLLQAWALPGMMTLLFIAIYVTAVPYARWGLLAVILVIERGSAARREWRGTLRDGLFMIVMWAVGVPLLKAVGFFEMFEPVTDWLASSRESYLGFELWPVGWPFALQVTLGMFVMEGVDYWLHRAMHRFAVLWRIHGVHHHITKMNVLVGPIVHPFQTALYILSLAVWTTLGIPPTVIATMAVIFLIISRFNHSNLKLGFPRLVKWFVTSPQDHFLHHSRANPDRNFACHLVFWDRVFGTYADGDRNPVDRVGSGAGVTLSIPQMLVFPFRRPDRVENPIRLWRRKEE